MNINILQSNNPYISKVREQNRVKKTDNKLSNKELVDSSKNLISKSERKYFADLFPDNSLQIEKHVLFNRNGKVTEINLNQGRLLDRKI
ncbi:MAG: hypothetical protein GX372_05500 [Ignavibacteria bacterium]|jgi:hypothetical protein|nr:hypothetical protein [Ignavibacteria bacterium]